LKIYATFEFKQQLLFECDLALTISDDFQFNTILTSRKDFSPKVLRIITDAPWYVPNTVIQRDLTH